MDKIGFIGLGNMGRPLAERLIKKYKLYAYDLNEKPTFNISLIKVL